MTQEEIDQRRSYGVHDLSQKQIEMTEPQMDLSFHQHVELRKWALEGTLSRYSMMPGTPIAEVISDAAKLESFVLCGIGVDNSAGSCHKHGLLNALPESDGLLGSGPVDIFADECGSQGGGGLDLGCVQVTARGDVVIKTQNESPVDEGGSSSTVGDAGRIGNDPAGEHSAAL